MSAILKPDSPLRRLPLNLDTRQRLFLDSIRYAIEMSDLAYRRLRTLLASATAAEIARDDNQDPDASWFPSAFLDALSVVDSGNRLRTLVGNMRGVKRTPEFVVLQGKLEPVENLRNPVQHLANEINRLVERNEPAWGSLSWVFAERPETMWSCTALPGATASYAGRPIVNPVGQSFLPPIDHVELTAYGHTVSLSETMSAIERLLRAFEASLAHQFEGLERLGSDLLLTVKLMATPQDEGSE